MRNGSRHNTVVLINSDAKTMPAPCVVGTCIVWCTGIYCTVVMGYGAPGGILALWYWCFVVWINVGEWGRGCVFLFLDTGFVISKVLNLLTGTSNNFNGKVNSDYNVCRFPTYQQEWCDVVCQRLVQFIIETLECICASEVPAYSY